ncbi:hypothetical protein H7S74_16885 [Priestia aryabhattai]|uniref:hypothetical protein n=1 Tax=Priestia TaxID=2800373 RepID=UPI001ED59609|nr:MULTISPECIES: hypothetical protein [Priestia]MBY0092597.1 hypothetical protein [Priestia aryabhattai]MBY0103040.1 hypothetical protein [Priestia aryabhattai]MCY9023615.1 hypothetical protein [Priestia megaterium]
MAFKKIMDAETASLRKQIRDTASLQDKEYYTGGVLEDLLRTAIVESDIQALNEFLHAMTRLGRYKEFRKAE